MKAILMPGRAQGGCANIGFLLIKPGYGGTEVAVATTDAINTVLSSMKIELGSGTTAPTANDLDLEFNITNQLTRISSTDTNATSRDDRTWAKNIISSYSSTFKNNTVNPITVNEIGLKTQLDGYNTFLLAREVLDEPKVIEPGKSCTFTITIG